MPVRTIVWWWLVEMCLTLNVLSAKTVVGVSIYVSPSCGDRVTGAPIAASPPSSGCFGFRNPSWPWELDPHAITSFLTSRKRVWSAAHTTWTKVRKLLHKVGIVVGMVKWGSSAVRGPRPSWPCEWQPKFWFKIQIWNLRFQTHKIIRSNTMDHRNEKIFNRSEIFEFSQTEAVDFLASATNHDGMLRARVDWDDL